MAALSDTLQKRLLEEEEPASTPKEEQAVMVNSSPAVRPLPWTHAQPSATMRPKITWRLVIGIRPGISDNELKFVYFRLFLLLVLIILPFAIYSHDLDKVRESWFVPVSSLTQGTRHFWPLSRLRSQPREPRSREESFLFLCCSSILCRSRMPSRSAVQRR
jgi:hypothetical protein